MKTTVNYSLVLFAAVLGCFSAACSSDDDKKNDNTGGKGGDGDDIVLTATETGWVDKASNPIGIQGAWYAYADSLGDNGMAPGKCQMNGHSDAECSNVETPKAGSFAPTADGSMCTKGTAAKVLAMDYSNMWGAGIALDFGAPSEGEPAGKKTVDLSAYSGISFELSAKPLAGLRVELPMPETEGTEAGSDYWGAVKGSWVQSSPVSVGVNTFKWAEVHPPGPGTLEYNPAKALGIQFHVPTTDSAAGPYEFCIKNLTIVK